MVDSPLCRYFANNCCRNGDRCRFSHDRTARADNVCRYYVQGACSYGSSCRYDHVRPARESKKPVPAPVEKDKPTTPACSVTPHEWRVDAATFIPGSTHTYALAAGSITVRPLCPYFVLGECYHGKACAFVHGERCELCGLACLHPEDASQRAAHHRECLAEHEAACDEAFAEARSRDRQCGICMEKIREKGGRFGILQNCRHCFCLDCIRTWRKSQQFENKIVRSCPECRTHSDYIIPAKHWVEEQSDKTKLIDDYRHNTAQKPCKYLREGRVDECPFGNKCFYKHQLPDGTVVEGASPGTLRRRRRQRNATLMWDFLREREISMDGFDWSDENSDDDDDDELNQALIRLLLAHRQ